jgi:hypothetical protein
VLPRAGDDRPLLHVPVRLEDERREAARRSAVDVELELVRRIRDRHLAIRGLVRPVREVVHGEDGRAGVLEREVVGLRARRRIRRELQGA